MITLALCLILTVILFCLARPKLSQLAWTIKKPRLYELLGSFLDNGNRQPPCEQRPKKILGPVAWPFLGSLHLLHHVDGPFVAFDKLAERYGDIYKIQLGTTECVVISSYDLIKEVLITKGIHFGGRPDFLRFHQLFGGDRNNSLALCDWSDLQRQRRSIARIYCSPRGGSQYLGELSRVASLEAKELIDRLNHPNNTALLTGQEGLKPLLQTCVANMFTGYMCSSRFGYDNKEFNRVVRLFDEIFWDINQGYALDFIPSLKPFYYKHLNVLSDWGAEIRNFILRAIIDERRTTLDVSVEPKDFTDALLMQLEKQESDLNWEHIMYELEDFLGGHSAIGNLTMLVLANSIIHPEVQKKIQEEVDEVIEKLGNTNGIIGLENRSEIPYTEAVMWETLRVASSPIVPHMSTKDTGIGGHFIKKGTMVYLNNLQLNLGEKYWGPDHNQFNPSRFLKNIVSESGESKTQIYKPEFFVPFSTGKRTCIGQRLVQGCTIVLIAALFRYFDISSVNSEDLRNHTTIGCVAVPPDTFHVSLKPRKVANL